MEKFSERVFKRVQPIWDSYLEHPFVKGIGDGDLAKDKFIHYMKQDYVYLIEYSRIFAIGASKEHDLETMTTFANLLHGTMNIEMDLHRSYAAEFGISSEELAQTEAGAVMAAYTSYMLNLSQRGGVENAACAMLACAWSYHYIGKALAQNSDALTHPFYGKWVQMYSSKDFADLANTAIDLVDSLTAGKPEKELKVLEDIIIKTSYFEYMFWDMAEQQEMWPVAELTS